MRSNAFLLHDEPSGATTSFVVGDHVIQAPVFIPEVKKDEDLKVLLRFSAAIPKGNPILVPANRWIQLISNPAIGLRAPLSGLKPVNVFLQDYPIFSYDPPEMFRYSMGEEIVRYALQGDRIKGRLFNGHLRKGEPSQAIDLIDPFFQPFVERQLSTIVKQLQKKHPKWQVPDVSNNKQPAHIDRAWLDERIDEAYPAYLYEIASQMQKMPNSVLIPPVPPLTKTSDNTFVSIVKDSNRAESIICERLSERNNPNRGVDIREIYPYYHIYLDWSIAKEKQKISTVLKLVEDGLEEGEFAGLALTMSGYISAAAANQFHKIEYLVNELVNISQQSEIPKPVILTRSGWFGLSLTDIEIQGFGGLLNGSYQYSSGGGPVDREDQFGKTPIIDSCVELKHSEVEDYIERYGEFPSVPNLPRKPDKQYYDDPTIYRMMVSKPRRLSHIEEARRVRKDKARGIQSPAKRYLEKSENIYLGANK